jgi:serine/threonine-protein kinase
MDPIKISGFELIERVGEGGMAAVWKARQLSLDRIVAIKLLPGRVSSHPDDIARLQAEARAAAKLKHPGIVQVYDASEADGVFYFVMEFVDGYTVTAWLRKRNVLSEDDALLIVQSVAEALNYAWKTAGIIHCDIKPDNIMVDADGTIKVTDLGLARLTGMRSEEADSEEVLGTPSYMSPEQAMGVQPLDCRTDIYSLGAALYQMVTGRRLFEGHTDSETMDLQIDGQAPDPIERNRTLSMPLCLLIEKMLVKDRDLRYPDWDAVLSDIRAIRRHQMPLDHLPAEGASTVKRSEARETHIRLVRSSHEANRTRRFKARTAMTVEEPTPRKKTWPLVVFGAVLAALFLIILIGAVVLQIQRAGRMRMVPSYKMTPSEETAPAPAEMPLERAAELFRSVQDWVAQHPDDYEEAMVRLRRVADLTRGTPYGGQAEEEIRKIENTLMEKCDAVLAELDQAAAKLVEERRFLEAAAVYETYSGPVAGRTLDARTRKAQALRDRAKALEDERARFAAELNEKLTNMAAAVSAALFAGDVPTALAQVNAVLAGELPDELKGALLATRQTLNEASNADQRVLESFRRQMGQVVTAEMVKGPRTFTVRNVKGSTVNAEEIVGLEGRVVFEFNVRDLSLNERLARLGSEDDPVTTLYRGMAACQNRQYASAAEWFARVPPPFLADILTARAGTMDARVWDEKAEQALVQVLKSLGVEVFRYDEAGWLQAIRRHPWSVEKTQAAPRLVEKYRAAYGRTSFAKRAAPILAVLAGEPVESAPPTPAVKTNAPAARAEDDARTSPESGARDGEPGSRGRSIYLCDCNETRSRVGWYRFMKGRLDGWEVNGRPVMKGIFAHAPSEVLYDIGSYHMAVLDGSVGVGRVTTNSEMRFKIFGDDKLLWESGVVRQGRDPGKSLTERFSVDVSEVKRLRLLVDPLGPRQSDNAVWINPRLSPRGRSDS